MDILNEFYGLRLARRTIIISFMANLIFVLGVWVTTLVPSIPQWEFSKTYDGIVHSIMAVLVASSAAYLISENVNSYLLCKIKELTNSRYLFVRVITSTVVASAIDSVVFCTLAFYNVLSWDIIKTMILSQFLIKVVYALVGVGPIYAARSLFNRYINTDHARSNEYAYQKQDKITHLGANSDYPDQYAPELLEALPRSRGRDLIGVDEQNLPFSGFDLWTAFELSWLNAKGKPVVGIGEFTLPHSSTNLIESKSFKLYLNSFNQTRFDSVEQVSAAMQKDLSQAANGQVGVKLYPGLDGYSPQIDSLPGINIDDLDIAVDDFDFKPEYLHGAADQHGDIVTETLSSNLLKSNCLVTNQPDWGSVVIHYQGRKIDRERLLRYLISFRQHNEFHEQCVERIFNDIKHSCQPEKLSVFARYTRRGGLDINPFRSDFETAPTLGRLIRQ